MVNGNDAQLRALELSGGTDGRVVEGAVAAVDGDGVVLAVGVAADVADDAELPVGRGQGLEGGEGGRRVGAEVDAVEEDVGLDDLGEGPAALGLGHVPLEDGLLGDAGGDAALDGALAAAAEGADDHGAGVLAVVQRQRGLDGGPDEVHELRGRVEHLHRALGLPGVQELVGPGQERQGCARVPGAVAESRDAAAAVVDQELQVV